eukprot:scaffold166799_cov21-Prasinocladus_malaysianus.AAC.1
MMSSCVSRLRHWGLEIRRQRAGHHKEPLDAPHLVPVGPATRQDGPPQAPRQEAGVPQGLRRLGSQLPP